MAEIIPNLSNETNHHDAALAASKDVPAHTVVAADKSLGAPTEATTLKGETAYTITQGKDTEKLQNAVYSFNTSLNPRVYENSLSNAISGAMKEYKGIYTSGNRPDGYNPYDSLNLSGVVMTEEQYGQAQRRLYEALADVEDEVIEADKKTTRDRVFSAFREQVRKAAKNRNGFVPQQIGTTTYDYPLLAKAEANVRRVKHNQGVEANALAQYKALPAEDRRLEDERISKKVASSMEKVTSSSSTSAFVAPSRVREVLLEDYQNDPVGRMAFLKKYADTIGIYQFLIESFDESVPSWRGQSDETIQLMAGSLFKNYGINLDPKSINPQYLKRTKIFNLQEALNFFGWLSPLYGPENTKETTYLLRKGDRIRNAQDYQEYQSANATAEEMNRWGEAGYQQYQQYVLDRLDEQYQGARGNAWYATAIPTILGSLRFMTEFAMSKGYGGAFSLANLMSYYLKASIPDKLNVEMGKDGKLIVKGKDRAFLTKFINETESGAISYFTEEKIGKLLDKGFSYLGQKIVPAGIRSFFSSSAISKFGIPKTGVGKVIRDVLPLNSAASEIVEEGAEKFIRAVSTQAAKLTGLEALDFNESFKITGEEAAMTAGTIVTQMALLGGIARVGNAFTAKRTNRMYSMQENVVRVAQQLNETNIKGDAAQKVLQDNGVGNQSICITPENAKAVQESAPEFAKSIGVTEESVLEAEKSQGLVEVPYRDLIVTMAESPTNIKAGAELVAKSNDALTAVDTKGMKQGEVQKALSEQLTKNREMEKVKQELVPAATEWAKKTMAEAKMDTADAKTVGQAMAVNLSFIAKENGVEAAKKALENISVKVTGEVQNYHSGDTVKEMGALDTNTPVGRALFDFYTASLGVNANLATPEEVAAEKDKRLAEAKAKGLKVNESVSPAAWYTEDGAITINPDAGMLFLFGHELGHLIQQASGGTESGFAGEIMKTVNSSKTKAMANLRQQIAQRYASVDLNGVNLFAEGTKNFDMELMGDVLGYVLQDPMTARVLAEEMEIRQKGNGSLFLYRVVEAIDKWISKIKELLGFLDKNAPEELRNARAMASALLNDYTVKQRKIASILADFQATYSGNASAEVGKQVGANTRYDLAYYQKPFAESVDEILKGTYSKKGNVFVSFTPKILEEIGLPRLPIMTTQKHIKTVSLSAKELERLGISGNAHNLGSLLKQIPEALANPESVIASEKRLSGRLVVITKLKNAQGEEIIVPIALGESSHIDGQDITAHIMTSAYGKHNALSLLERAIENEKNGAISVFYLNKKHTPLLDIPRLQLPSSTKENGVTVHKITDLGSSVKSGIKNQTDTIQFRNWFKNSKVVDKDGKPLVVYHGTETGGFSVFDIDRARSESGVWFTTNKQLAEEYSDNWETEGMPGEESQIYSCYLRILVPCIIDAHGQSYDDLEEEIQEAASNPMYDGIIIHGIKDPRWSSSKLGPVDTFFVKNPSQIKSATDNVGTFDRNSNNIYYALTPVSDNALIEGPKAVLEIMQNATSLDFVDAIGRWGYQMAKDLAAADPEGSLAKDMEILDTWINSKENPHKQGTVEYEHWKADRFTEAFSRYIVNGTVAKGVLLPFGDLKRLLTHVYQSGKYNPKFAVPMEVRQVFDSILTASEEINDTLPYDTVLSMLGEEATQGLLRAGNKSVLRKLVLMSSEEARSIQEKMVHEELEPLRKLWYGEAKIAEENRPSAKAIKAIKDNGLLALSDIAVIAPDVDAETIGKLRERGLIREKNGQSAIKVAEAGGYADVQSMLYDVANGKSAVDFINEYMAKMEGDYLASREANPSGEAIGCESAIIMLNYLEDILTGKYNIDSVSVPAEAQKAMDLARELASLAAQKEPSANKIMMTMGRLSEAISKMGEEYADFKKDAQAIMDDMQSMQDKQDAEYYAKIEQLMGRVLKLDKAQDVRKVVAGISKAAVRNKYSARAAEVISGMTVGQILSSYRPLAEIRSNARNLIELLGQNTPNAEKAVLLADALMLKMETFRQLSKAKKNIEKAVRILKKEARVPAGKIDPEYQKALQELSYMFGLSGVDTGNDGQTLKAIANDEESRLENEGLGLNAEGPAIAPWILEQRAPLSYKALPMERMQALVDAADYLYGKGKDIVQGEKEGKTLEVVESVLGFLRDQAGKEMTYTDSLDKSFLETVASTYRVSALEGVKMWRFLKELGPTMAAWYAKLSQAEHEEMALYQRTGLKAVEALDKLDALLSKVDLKKLPEFGSDYRSIKKWTTPRLTMALLYMGTTSGRQRLMDGFKWRTAEEAKVADDTDVAPILHQICGMVPAEALQQINIIWDAVNGELAKAVKAEYRKETYKELREIERAPFQTVSSDGKVVWMKGGYIPLSYQYSGPGEHLVAPSVGEGGKIVSFSANPVFADPSFTRGRMESYMDTPPLNLDVNTVTTHVQNAANYATHRTLIRQLYRVITNERGIRVSDTEKTMSFRERYVRTYGAERYKYMKGMLKYMANPYESVRGGRGMLAALTKSIFAFKALWGNFSPVLMQMTSASVGANEIGGFFWSSLIDMFAHPIESMRFASEVSPLIRNRAGFQEVALAEAGSRLGKGKAYRFWKNMQNVGMFLTNLVDRIVATIGFNGAYAKAMSEGKTHNAAVVEAEEFVAKTQGSKRPLDMMPVQVPTVSALKSIGAAMTPFISAVGAQQNVTAHNLFSVKGSAKVMGLVCSFLIPMLMQGWFRDLLTGGLSDDKKKRKKAHKRALAEMLAQPLAGVPYYRDLLESMARAAVGLRQHDPFSISDLGAVTDLWNKGWGVYDDLTNADWDHAIYMSVDAFSTAFGVPAITAYQRAIKILEAYGIDVPNFEDTKDKKNRRKK